MRRLNELWGGTAESVEGLSDASSGDRIQAWVLGVVVAAALAAYGLYCILTEHAVFIAGRPAIRLTTYFGANAVALGVAYLAVACFLHCHFSWSFRERFYGYAQIGKLVCLLGFVGGIVYLVVNSIVFG